jgi:hypothetical protein
VTEADRETVEQAIAEAQLSPYQAMVIRTIAEGENMTAALTFLEQVSVGACGGDESVASGASVDANVQVHQGQGRNGSGGFSAASTGILGSE